MKKLTIISAAIYAALALSGCSKDSTASSGIIRCRVRPAAFTKAVEVDLDSIKKTGFTMLGIIDDDARDYDAGTDYSAGTYIDNKTVSWSASKWSIAGNPTWVLQDSMRFWCWTPTASGLTINPASSSLIGKRSLDISLTMPEGGSTDASSHASDAKSQHDILFSYNAAYRADSGSSSDLEIKFGHALSNIRFCVAPSTNTTSTPTGYFRYDYSIVSIALQDVSRTADCTVTGSASTTAATPSFAWKNQSGTTSYTQYYGASFKTSSSISCPSGWTSRAGTTYTAIYTANEGFFVIPQAIGATTSLAVTLTNGSKTTTLSVPLKGEGTSEWLPGKYYTYGIAVSKDISDPAGFSVTLVDWDSTDYSVRF